MIIKLTTVSFKNIIFLQEFEHNLSVLNKTVATTNNAHSIKQHSRQLTKSHKSVSSLNCANERPYVNEAAINPDGPFSPPFHRAVISHSLPELMLPSTKTPAFLSVQSCEKLSAIEKEVEIPRATNKYLPVSFNFDYRKHLYVA